MTDISLWQVLCDIFKYVCYECLCDIQCISLWQMLVWHVSLWQVLVTCLIYHWDRCWNVPNVIATCVVVTHIAVTWAGMTYNIHHSDECRCDICPISLSQVLVWHILHGQNWCDLYYTSLWQMLMWYMPYIIGTGVGVSYVIYHCDMCWCDVCHIALSQVLVWYIQL